MMFTLTIKYDYDYYYFLILLLLLLLFLLLLLLLLLQAQSSPSNGQPQRQPCTADSRSSLTSGHTGSFSSRYSPTARFHTLVIFSVLLDFFVYLADILSPFLYPNGMWRHFNRSTTCIAPLPEGAPWRCRLGCEHDTLRLLLLRPHAGTQPIRPTCTPANLQKIDWLVPWLIYCLIDWYFGWLIDSTSIHLTSDSTV